MHHLLFPVILALTLSCPFQQARAQTYTLMTWNIRYDNPADGPNAWSVRKDWVCSILAETGPDILGIQEGLHCQLLFLDSCLTGFQRLGVGREDGKKAGEHTAVYYRKDRFRLIRHRTFWLSPTPDRVSTGWDAALPRICTCGLFKDRKTGKKFWVFNTHFDHMGETAREQSARLILSEIARMNPGKLGVVVMGDFNAGPGSAPIQTLSEHLTDAKTADKSMSAGPEGTFNGFDPGKPVTERIDFIFTQPKSMPVLDYRVLRATRSGLFPSDHDPVVAECMLH